jgi:hypothetical protein
MSIAAAFVAADWSNEFLLFDDEVTLLHSRPQPPAVSSIGPTKGVIGRQSGDMGHELAAFRAMSRRGDTDLYPNSYGHAPCPCRCTQLPARTENLAPARKAQSPGEDFFELGIAVDAPPDVADDAAQIDLEPAQAFVGALELMSRG